MVEHADYAFNRVYFGARTAENKALAERVREAYLQQLTLAFSFCEELSVDVFGREIRQIFLIHANEINSEVLSQMLQLLKDRGYSFVSLDEALKDEAYRTPENYAGRSGISWLHRWSLYKDLPLRIKEEPVPPAFIMRP